MNDGANNEISILLVEDEDIWIKAMKMLIADLGMQLVGVATTVEDAITAFARENYDIILLDIHIGGKASGLELGNIVNSLYKKPFIFVTAANDHDLKMVAAASPAAYLQKPVSLNSLNIAVNRAIANHVNPRAGKETEVEPTVFFIKEGTRYVKLDWRDISHLTAGKNYVRIYNVTDGQEYYIRNSLQNIIAHLVPAALRADFIRVNRSEVVQFSHIRQVTSNEVITDRQSFSLSDTYGRDLKARMNVL